MPLSKHQKRAIDLLVGEAGRSADPAAFITFVTPATPEVTPPIVVTLVGNCLTPEWVSRERDELIGELKKCTSLEDLKKLAR